MKVLCTGPESSGTRLLTRIVSTGAYAMHRSLPHGDDWWVGHLTGFDAVVAIYRNEQATIASAVARSHVLTGGQAADRRRRALQELETLDPVWVRYEDIVSNVKWFTELLGQRLGVTLTFWDDVYDGNAKWL